MASYPKTCTELRRKNIPCLIKEIETLSANLFENLILNENLSQEARGILDGKAEQVSERIAEVYGRKRSQRMNYWDSLNTQKEEALRQEDFISANRLTKKLHYFRHFIKDALTPTYF